MTSDRILMNPRPSGLTKIKGKKADNSIIDMLTFDPDAQTITPKVPMVYGTRNAVINGGFDFWQRGVSGSFSNSTQSYLTADRWANACYPGVACTVQRISGGANNSQYAIQFGRNAGASAVTNVQMNHVIESTNCYSLAGKQVTLSFWARCGSGASLSLVSSINTGSGIDQGVSSMMAGTWTNSASFTATNTLTTSWVKYTLTATIPAGTSEIGVTFYYSGVGTTAPANEYIQISQVMLNEGDIAAPFERAGGSIGGEEQLCQRYYYRLNDFWVSEIPGLVVTGTSSVVLFPLPVTMRIIPAGSSNFTDAAFVSGVPSATQWALTVTGQAYAAKTGTASISAVGVTKSSIVLRILSASFSPTPNCIYMGTSMYWDASAEL